MRIAGISFLALAFSFGTSARITQGHSVTKRTTPNRLSSVDYGLDELALNHTSYERDGLPILTERDPLVTLVADTCITIRSSNTFKVKAAGVSTDVKLDAGTCVCVNGKLQYELVSIIPLRQKFTLIGEVTGSGGLYFTGEAGASLATQVSFVKYVEGIH